VSDGTQTRDLPDNKLADLLQMVPCGGDWTVVGAVAGPTNAATLTIPALPPEGTNVVVSVEVINGSGLHARGALQFATVQEHTGLDGMVRRLDCALRNLKEAHRHIPPWVPVENDRIIIDRERIELIRTRAQSMAVVARQVEAAAKAIEAHSVAE
jgi:hypothetical protein